MKKSQMRLDCEDGYTLRQAIKRSVARDPITQADLATVRRKGWHLSSAFRKTLATAAEAPAMPEGLR